MVWLSFVLLSAAYWIICLAEFYGGARSGSPGDIGLTTIGSGLRGVTLSTASAEMAGRLMGLAILVYLLGLFSMGATGAWRRIQLARALSYRIEPPDALTKVFRNLAAEMQAPTSHLWLLPGLTSPASIGCGVPGLKCASG